MGDGIAGDFGPVTVSSSTTAMAQITILTSALPGPRTVSVETGTEQASLTDRFEVVGLPSLISLSPNSAEQGQTVTVLMSGSYSNLVEGTTQANFGPGTSVGGGPAGGFGPVTVISPISATAQVMIDGSAILGSRTVVAQTGVEQASIPDGFSILGPVIGPPPTVTITSPAEADEVTSPTTVTGTGSSPNLDSWTLDYPAPGSSGFTTFAKGTSSTVSGVFDPTLLLNGNVTIRLSATDTSGQSAIPAMVTVVVTRNLKIGNFTLSFNDLTLPVAGLPIQVVRTYDSRDKSPGDFGIGWTLDLKTVRTSANGPLGDQRTGTKSGGFVPNYCIVASKPHVVTVAFTDGTTYEFTPNLSPGCRAAPIDQVTMVKRTEPNAPLRCPNKGVRAPFPRTHCRRVHFTPSPQMRKERWDFSD